MTEIDIFRDKSGNIARIECSGHSGYADEGSDIVCASVTSVIYSALNGIENVLHIAFGYETGDGYLLAVMPDDLDDTQIKHISILLESMYLFLVQLAQQYPDNISISELEV
ncbi:MAG: ribosomal-processing cysteine protease Prp [Clostridia bacterium]|nr:ribosomal-processing cysteine protease Prp [Clostridia bacterium]